MERDTVIKTYSLDKEIAEKFSEQTPKQKTSQELEKLMADYIDEDMQDKKQPIKFLDRDVVSDKRRKLVETIVEKDYWRKTGPQIFKKLKSQGEYQGDSGSYHFKQAIKFLETLDGSGVVREKRKIVPEQFICREDGCDAKISLKVLSKNDMVCPKCERRYEI